KHRPHQGFADIGEDRGALTSARIGLGSTEPDGGAEIDLARHLGAGLLADEVGEPARQFAFVGFDERAKQHLGNNQTEDVIAEKLEALIAARPALAAQCRNMGERALEQRLIGKFITDPCLKFAPAGCRPSAHLTIVNSRLQRTDHGQLQMCQAGSPSPMEKKMICALPTRFSNGTYPTADSTRLSVELSRLSPIMK